MEVEFAQLTIYPGEDEGALKQAFIDFSARHHANRFSSLEICEHIFKTLKDPNRYIQAAQLWSKDLEIQEAIQNKINFGNAQNAKEQRVAILMSIAENIRTSDKDRIAAILAAAAMEGEITKAVEKKVTHLGPGGKGNATFLFKIDNDAGNPPEEVDESE